VFERRPTELAMTHLLVSRDRSRDASSGPISPVQSLSSIIPLYIFFSENQQLLERGNDVSDKVLKYLVVISHY
jgi:hypothetical protein